MERKILMKQKNNQKPKESGLFNNPMINAAKEALSEEEKEKYARIGTEMYKDIDFDTNKNLNNQPAPMAEATAYIVESIKSGLHPSMLDNDEKTLLYDAFGDDWWEQYGYVKEDLNEIVTLKH